MILLNGDEKDCNVDTTKIAENISVETALLCMSLVGDDYLCKKADRCKCNSKRVFVAY